MLDTPVQPERNRTSKEGLQLHAFNALAGITAERARELQLEQWNIRRKECRDPVELLSAARRKHEHVKMRKVQHASHSTSAAEGLSWLEEEQEEGPHFDELQQELEALMERVKIKALPPGVPTSSSAAAKVTRPTMCEELLEEVLMEDEGWGYGSPGAAALAQKLGKRVAEQQANQVDRGTGRKPLYQSPTPQQQQQRRSLDVGHGSSSCHASFTHKSGAAGPGGGLGAAGGPGGAGLAPLANPEQRSSPAPGLSSLLISQELGGLRRASSNEDLSTSLGSSMAGGRLGDKAGGGVTAGSGGAAGGSELAGPKPRVSAAGSLNTSLLGGALPAIKPSKLGPALHAAAEPAAGQAPVGPPWMGSSAHAAPGGPAHSRGAGAHPHPASASKRSSSSGVAHLPELGKQGAQAGAVLQQQSPLGLPAYRRSLPNYTGPPVRSSPQLLLEPWDAPGPVTPPERSPPAGSDPHLPPAHCVSSPLCDQATSTSILPSPSASLTAGGGGALQPVRPPCLFSGPPSASGTPSMVSHSPMMRKLSGLPKGEAQIAQFDITSGPTGLESSMATLIDLSPTMTDPSPTVRSSMDGLAKILLSRHSNSGPQRMGSLGLEPTATSHSPSPHGKIVLSRSSSLGHGPGSGGGSANNASNSNYGPGPGPTSGPSNRGISRLAGPG